MALIDTPTVQRLRGIKQLGTSNLVFPSAVHTRFEHSLGTCWLVKRLLRALRSEGHEIAPEEERTATLSALLHDITHVPFGHTFEDERRLFDRHDEDYARARHFLDQPAVTGILRASGVAPAVHTVLAGGDSARPFVAELIRGTIGADLLDYLKRDAFFTGLALDYDDRLLHYFHLADGHLVVRLHKAGGFRRDALSELVHLLQMRYALTERVYYHHAKVAAGAMISRALELALGAGVFTQTELYDLRDDSLLARLAELAARVEGLADLLGDLFSRRLYRRAYLLTAEGFGTPGLREEQRDALAARYHSDLAGRQAAEAQIAAQLGAPPAHVIIYCPSPKMALKEANVPVELSPGDIRPLSALGHPDVAALEEKHRGLWRFYVCLRREHADKLDRISPFCEELFGHPNQLETQQRGKLAFGR